MNLNLTSTSFSSNISKKPDCKQTVAAYFSFKRSLMETPIKVVEKVASAFERNQCRCAGK